MTNAATPARYIAINRTSTEVGCGHTFRELRTYIQDTETGKLVRDIGHAKYSADAAAKVAARLNERNVAVAA